MRTLCTKIASLPDHLAERLTINYCKQQKCKRNSREWQVNGALRRYEAIGHEVLEIEEIIYKMRYWTVVAAS